MKKLTLFLLTILISCSAWGAKIYLKPNSNWATDNARFAAYFFGNGEKWVSMTPVFDAYEVDVPPGFSKVIFCRMNPSNTTNGWSNKYNQTGDLSIPNNGNNCFTVPNGAWDGSTTSWGKYNYSDLYVAGTMNNWSTTEDKLVYSSDKSSADFSKDLEPGDYEFKISRGAWDWSKGAEIFDKDNSDVINANTKDNVKFNLQNKANVRFILSKEQKISVQLYYDVKVTAGTGGSVSSGGDNIRHKTSTTIKATPNTGYHFVQWSDGDTNAERKIEVTENLDLTATFAIDTYTVSVSANPAEGGSVTGIDEKTYPYGTQLTFKAVPAPGYEFIKWSDENIDNPRTITITEEINSLYAIFELKNMVFTNETDFEFATYGHLSYQLTMSENRWYWISLPFDVNVAEITVDGATNGVKNSEALVITEYNAEARATGKQGWTNINSNILKANKGYVMGPTDGAYNVNMVVNFPSTATTNDVNSSAKDTLTSTGGDAQNANWYIIGTGLYHQGSLSNINYVAMPAKNDKGKDTYEYKYISSGNELFTEKLGTNSFAPFTAFFVQYGGPYSATAPNAQSAALAPVARAKAQEQEQIYLINMNEAHTVVILNAEGSEGYTAGEDFLEMNASNHSDLIYSFDGTDALAFNHRATEAQSINLGGYVATAGEQTISLKGYNANVESVTLVDNVTGETADLLAGDYTFNAEVGSLDGRFTVVFGAPKAGDTTVDCYNSTANQLIAYGSANACTVSGLTTGEAVVVYNAMGQLVFATIADSETLTLPSLTTGNYLILHNGTTNKVLLK